MPAGNTSKIVRCETTTKNGKPCKNRVIAGEKYCSVHNPQKKVKKARKRLSKFDIVGLIIGILGIVLSIYYGTISPTSNEVKRLQNDINEIQYDQISMFQYLTSQLNTVDSSGVTGKRYIAKEQNNIEIEYDLESVNYNGEHDDKSNFKLIPKLAMDSAFVFDQEIESIGFYFNTEKLLSVFKRLPKDSIHTLNFDPGERYTINMLDSTQGDRAISPDSAWQYILPFNSKMVGTDLEWAPSINSAGFSEYLILLSPVDAELEFPVTIKNKTFSKRLKGPFGLEAKATRLHVREGNQDLAFCEFKPFKNIKGTFYIKSEFKLSNISSASEISTEKMVSSILRSFKSFIYNLPDDKVNTYTFRAGDKVKLEIINGDMDFFMVPNGAIVSGKKVEWMVQNKNIGHDQYFIVNNSKIVRMQLSKESKVLAEAKASNLPGLFTVYRVRVI